MKMVIGQKGWHIMENNIWFTSDLHFCHDKEFLYKPRGFKTIYEHNEAIIENWNKTIGDNDLVYVLGDLMLKDNDLGRKCFNQLRGYKYIILGNHDSEARQEFYPSLRGIIGMAYAKPIKFNKYTFFLCHYPTKVGNYDDEETHKKKYCLCGHTHTNNRWLDFKDCKSYHVELDAHNNTPIHIEDIVKDIQKY